jgi:hypothetical protein
MRTRRSTVTFLRFALTLVFDAASLAQDNAAPSTMASIDPYLMNRDTEIAMARSAGPNSVSSGAKVLVLGRHGYETAVEGKNDFVCLVERSWAARKNAPDFWDPKVHGPVCHSAAVHAERRTRAIMLTDVRS